MEPKYQRLGETLGLKSNCRPGLPQRSAGEGRWKSWALLWLTLASCLGCGESTWSVDWLHHRFPLQLVGTGMLDPDGHTLLSQPLYAPLLHPHPWCLMVGVLKGVYAGGIPHQEPLIWQSCTPSGWFPSALYRPDGMGMFADVNEWSRTLLSSWWRETLP